LCRWLRAPLISWLGWRGRWSVFCVLRSAAAAAGRRCLLDSGGPETTSYGGWHDWRRCRSFGSAAEKLASWQAVSRSKERAFGPDRFFSCMRLFVKRRRRPSFPCVPSVFRTQRITVSPIRGGCHLSICSGVGSVDRPLAAVASPTEGFGRGLSLAAVDLRQFCYVMWGMIRRQSVWQLTICAMVFGSCWGGLRSRLSGH